MALTRVVLPEPLGPTRPKISPWPMLAETFFRACTPPNQRLTLSQTRTGSCPATSVIWTAPVHPDPGTHDGTGRGPRDRVRQQPDCSAKASHAPLPKLACQSLHARAFMPSLHERPAALRILACTCLRRLFMAQPAVYRLFHKPESGAGEHPPPLVQTSGPPPTAPGLRARPGGVRHSRRSPPAAFRCPALARAHRAVRTSIPDRAPH